MKTRILGIVALVAIVAATVNALFIVPADVNQGDAQRIMYVHVPSAWNAFIAFFVVAVASLLYLLKGEERYDRDTYLFPALAPVADFFRREPSRSRVASGPSGSSRPPRGGPTAGGRSARDRLQPAA